MGLLEDISQGLQLPVVLIRNTAHKASYSYRRMIVPKASGGTRELHHPSRPLKAIQRWLLYNFIVDWPVHDAVYGYRRGRSIRDNAQCHADSAYLLRMDITEFFPSITKDDIMAFLQECPPRTESWEHQDKELFQAITCRHGSLTIGAPTSPALSNALCYHLDSQVAGLSTELGVTFTRYADDLFFSSSEPHILRTVPERIALILNGIPYPRDLKINNKKTRHSSKKGRRQVTGLVLTSDGSVSLGRQRKRFVRGQVHKIDELSDTDREHLSGLLAFATDIEPDFLNALVLKYGTAKVSRAKRAKDSKNR